MGNEQQSVSFPDEYWIMSSSIPEETINDRCKYLLESAKYSSEADGPLYTQRQMVEMFREGYAMFLDTPLGQKILKAIRKTHAPYAKIRDMEVGELLLFPYVKWKTVRTAASRLKIQYGAEFTVRKLGEKGEINDILVTRIK